MIPPEGNENQNETFIQRRNAIVNTLNSTNDSVSQLSRRLSAGITPLEHVAEESSHPLSNVLASTELNEVSGENMNTTATEPSGISAPPSSVLMEQADIEDVTNTPGNGFVLLSEANPSVGEMRSTSSLQSLRTYASDSGNIRSRHRRQPSSTLMPTHLLGISLMTITSSASLLSSISREDSDAAHLAVISSGSSLERRSGVSSDSLLSTVLNMYDDRDKSDDESSSYALLDFFKQIDETTSGTHGTIIFHDDLLSFILSEKVFERSLFSTNNLIISLKLYLTQRIECTCGLSDEEWTLSQCVCAHDAVTQLKEAVSHYSFPPLR